MVCALGGNFPPPRAAYLRDGRFGAVHSGACFPVRAGRISGCGRSEREVPSVSVTRLMRGTVAERMFCMQVEHGSAWNGAGSRSARLGPLSLGCIALPAHQGHSRYAVALGEP